MINSSAKDSVLRTLCSVQDFESLLSVPLKEFLEEVHLNFDELSAIFTQFRRMGFISDLNMRRHISEFYITVHLEALDFLNLGGFTIHEETLKLTLEKLQLEVSNLQNQFPENSERFTGILANIATCISLLMVPK